MFTLVIWAVLASDRASTHRGWQPIAHSIYTEAMCEKAAAQLSVKSPNFRCIRTS